MKLNLNELIPSVYNNFIGDLLHNRFTTYSLYGGRGSVKSSVGGLISVLMVLLDRGNVLVDRRYGNSLRDSAYAECLVAIERLGVQQHFTAYTSPLSIHCHKTGLVIYFRGLDDPQKVKSLKPSNGRGFALLWHEEAQEIEKEAKTRSVLQTVVRTDTHTNVLHTYNPPQDHRHFVNRTLRIGTQGAKVRNVRCLHVNYTDVPKVWLGKQFLEEAERLKEIDKELWEEEYMGVVREDAGRVFKNIEETTKTKHDFPYLCRGVDFGFAKAGDPCAYTVCAYDKEKRELYILDEWYAHDSDYNKLADGIKGEMLETRANPASGAFKVYCDNADPGGIKQLRLNGVAGADKCKKGLIKTRMAWFRGLNKIYINKQTAPNHYREFTGYVLVQKRDGTVEYSDKDNHTLDSTWYALSHTVQI